MSSAYNFLSNLSFGDNNYRMFSEIELKSESVKWLKRRMLIDFGLMSEREFQFGVSRFRISDIENARIACTQFIMALTRQFIVVLKIVPKSQVGLLRNFIIKSFDQVDFVFQEIKRMCSGLPELEHELWFCHSITEVSALHISGRLLYCKDLSPTIIEAIWYSSPRRIEEVNTFGSFDYPFCRAFRNPGRLSFEIATLTIPTNFLNTRAEQDYRSDFKYLLSLLHRKAERLSIFVDMMLSNRANTVSLDFIADSKQVNFIDWDTECDLFR